MASCCYQSSLCSENTDVEECECKTTFHKKCAESWRVSKALAPTEVWYCKVCTETYAAQLPSRPAQSVNSTDGKKEKKWACVDHDPTEFPGEYSLYSRKARLVDDIGETVLAPEVPTFAYEYRGSTDKYPLGLVKNFYRSSTSNSKRGLWMIIMGRNKNDQLCTVDRRPDEVELIIGDAAIANESIANKTLKRWDFKEADHQQYEEHVVTSLNPGGGRTFVSKLGQIHVVESRLRSQTTCQICGKNFPTSTFKKHQQVCQKTCKDCNKQYSDDKQHREVCSETPKICSTCNAAVANKRALVSHQKTAHPKATPNHKEVRCTTCDQTFKSPQGLKSHMKTHQVQTECPSPSDHDDCKSCHVCNWLNLETRGKKRKKAFDEHMTGHKKREQELEWEVDRLRRSQSSKTVSPPSSTSDESLLTYLKDDRANERRIHLAREQMRERNLLQFAAILTGKQTDQKQGEPAFFAWTPEDVRLYVYTELQMEGVSKQLFESKVSGLDFRHFTNIAKGSFDVDGLIKELELGGNAPTSREKVILQRALESQIRETHAKLLQ